MEERIDFFGKYSDRMNSIHRPVLPEVINSFNMDNKISEFLLVQCNFAEYLEHHPEEPKYLFELYEFEYGSETGRMLFAFNSYFFKSRDEIYPVIDLLIARWKDAVDIHIKRLSESNSINDLKEHDMLQTAHYLYPEKSLLDNKTDYQLFKVIYPYNTLKPVFDEWDTEI